MKHKRTELARRCAEFVDLVDRAWVWRTRWFTIWITKK